MEMEMVFHPTPTSPTGSLYPYETTRFQTLDPSKFFQVHEYAKSLESFFEHDMWGDITMPHLTDTFNTRVEIIAGIHFTPSIENQITIVNWMKGVETLYVESKDSDHNEARMVLGLWWARRCLLLCRDQQQAIQECETSYKIAQQNDLKNYMREALYLQAKLLNRMNHCARALECALRMLRYCDSANQTKLSKFEVARMQIFTGKRFLNCQMYADAQTLFQNTLKMLLECKDDTSERNQLLGMAYGLNGFAKRKQNSQGAILDLQSSLIILRGTPFETRAHTLLGDYYFSHREYDKAMQHTEMAIKICKHRPEFFTWFLWSHYYRAGMLSVIGMCAEANDTYNLLDKLLELIEWPKLRIYVKNDWADMLARQRSSFGSPATVDHGLAIEIVDTCLGISNTSRDSTKLVMSQYLKGCLLESKARAQIELNQTSSALTTSQDLYEIALSIRNDTLLFDAHRNIGVCRMNDGTQSWDALEHFHAARHYARQSDYKRADVLEQMALFRCQRKEWKQAAQLAEESVECFKRLIKPLTNTDNYKNARYIVATICRMAQVVDIGHYCYAKEALMYPEDSSEWCLYHGKALRMLDNVRSMAQYYSSECRRAKAPQYRSKAARSADAASDSEMFDTTRYEDVWHVEHGHPNATIIIFSLVTLQQFDTLLAWTVESDGTIHFAETMIRGTKFERILNDLRQGGAWLGAFMVEPDKSKGTIADYIFGSDDNSWAYQRTCRLLKELYSLFFEGLLTQRLRAFPPPDADNRRNPPHLIIIPDERISLIPWGCLMDTNDKFLVQDYSISVSPSRKMLYAAIDHGRNARLPVPIQRAAAMVCGQASFKQGTFSDDRTIDKFQFTEPEKLKDAIQALFENDSQGSSVEVLLDEKFSKKAIVDELFKEDRRFVLLHIHSHASMTQRGAPDNEFASTGGILCTNTEKKIDGKLESKLPPTYIYATDFTLFPLNSTQLVVLSCCQGSASANTTPFNTLAIHREVLIAGSPLVLTTVASVLEIETSKFMQQFYKELKVDKCPARALRRASIKNIGSGNSNDDTHVSLRTWGSFQLIGDALTCITCVNPPITNAKSTLCEKVDDVSIVADGGTQSSLA